MIDCLQWGQDMRRPLFPEVIWDGEACGVEAMSSPNFQEIALFVATLDAINPGSCIIAKG